MLCRLVVRQKVAELRLRYSQRTLSFALALIGLLVPLGPTWHSYTASSERLALLI